MTILPYGGNYSARYANLDAFKVFEVLIIRRIFIFFVRAQDFVNRAAESSTAVQVVLAAPRATATVSGQGGAGSSAALQVRFTLGVSLGRRSKKLAELRVIVSIPISL